MNGLDKFRNKIDKFSKNSKRAEKEIVKLGSTLKRDIIKRTQSGLDANRNNFKEYSAEYAEHKKESGRNTSTVNLTFRFDMLKSITPKAIKRGVRLFFNDSRQLKKAIKHIEGKGVPKRNFWGFDDKQVKFFRKTLTNLLRKGIII